MWIFDFENNMVFLRCEIKATNCSALFFSLIRYKFSSISKTNIIGMWYLRCTCNQHWRESQWHHRRRQKSHCRRTHHKRWNCGLCETIVGWWKIVLRFFPISSKFKIRITLFFLYTSSPLVNRHSNKRTPSINGQILLHHN